MLLVLGLILLLSAFACSTALCALTRTVARRLDFVDRPGGRKIHHAPVALGGGSAFFLTTLLIVGVGVLLALIQHRTALLPGLPGLLERHVPLIVDRAALVGWVLAGGAVIFALGFLDDLFRLAPITRLAVQAAVAAVLCVLSDDLRLTAFVGSRPLSFAYTVLWIVGITNAFNLLDNMDGLSAGVGAVASAVFFVVAALTGQFFLAALLLVFAGALLGFLVFNFPPATLFMGDAGSMFIGYFLAVLTILFTFYMPGRGYNPFGSLFIPLVILAVPIYDTISVICIRLAAGRSIFSGDTNHFSHRLVALGMSRRQAVLTICLVTLCTGLLAPLLLQLHTGMAFLVFANVTVMLALVWLLEHAARSGRNGQGGAR